MLRFLDPRGTAVAIVVFGTLAACAPSPTPYQPSQGRNGFGFSEQQIEQNRFRISFSGNSDTRREVVENYLLIRAAELTLANGYDHFILASQDVEPNIRYRSTFTGYSDFGFYHHSWPWFDTGVDYGTSYPVTRYTAYADILLLRGPKDGADYKSFSAADVLAKLGPTAQRPLPPK